MGHNTCKSMGRVLCVVRREGNRLIINGEIDEKHALQNYQIECGPG